MTEPGLLFPQAGPRALPHSEEAERAVLGAVLLEPRLLAEHPIWSDLFYFEKHRTLLAELAEMHAEGEQIDLLTLRVRLESRFLLDTIGGAAYLASLDLDLPDIAAVGRYVEILGELRTRRALIEIGGRVVRRALDSDQATAQQIAAAQAEIIAAVAGRELRAGAQSLGAAALEMAERYVALGPREVVGLTTGLPDLDAVLGGFETGRLIVIAGRPGMGKSSLAQQIAEHQKGSGHEGLVVTLEMTVPEFATRALVRRSEVSYDRMRSGHMTDRHRQRVLAAARTVADRADLAVIDSAGLTMAEIAFAARAKATAGGLRVLWIDHVGLVEEERRYESRAREVAAYSRAMKNLAKQLDMTVVALSQLNRECEKRGDKRPVLSDLRESGAIEQDADAVLFVHRPEVYWPEDSDVKGLAELIVAKNRDGATGTVPVAWLGELMTFRSLAKGAYP